MNKIKPGVWYNERKNKLLVVIGFHEVSENGWCLVMLGELGPYSVFLDCDKIDEIFIGEW